MFNAFACPNHRNQKLFEDYKTGDIICTICGLVVGDRILEACLPFTYEELYEENLPKSQPTVVSDLCEKMHLSASVVEKAEEIYAKINLLKIFHTKTKSLCAAVAVFTTCRLKNNSRTFEEVSYASSIAKKDICRYYKNLLMKCPDLKQKQLNMETAISRYAASFGLSFQIEKRAEKIYSNLKEEYGNKSPLTKIAAAIFVAAAENNTKMDKKMVASTIGVHVTTFNSLIREMNKSQVKF